MDFYFIHLFIIYFNIEIISNVANRSPFSPDPLSFFMSLSFFEHVLISGTKCFRLSYMFPVPDSNESSLLDLS